jgi:predicted ATP-dependent endonuclease of OLD family
MTGAPYPESIKAKPARVRSMRFQKYRGFEDVTLPLPDHGVVFIVGKNNSGKTTT